VSVLLSGIERAFRICGFACGVGVDKAVPTTSGVKCRDSRHMVSGVESELTYIVVHQPVVAVLNPDKVRHFVRHLPSAPLRERKDRDDGPFPPSLPPSLSPPLVYLSLERT
jgi:hypothetical protein